MQSLTGSEIELADHARDGRRRSRAQRLLHGPERLRGVLGLDQNDAPWIETEAVEAMTVGAATGRKPAGRGDKQEPALRHPAQQRCHKAEGGGHVAFGFRHDLMQGSAGQAALRQVRIEGRQAEGQGARPAGGAAPGQQMAQLLNDFSAFVGAMESDGQHGRARLMSPH